MTRSRGLLIDGAEVPADDGRTVPDHNPYTGEVIATVAAASVADVTRAVDAAAKAFDDWAGAAPTLRARILLRAADLFEARAGAVAATMTAETGATVGWGMFNVGLAAAMLREAAAAATRPVGEVLATDNPGALALAVRQPAGVVAAFAPWNAPVILGTRAVAAPLAVGNSVVLKASEEAPMACALVIGEILTEAGLPPGVLNIVTNASADAAVTAAALIGDPRVRRVNFTGSTRVGREIARLAADQLKPVVLELGGKNAVIVLDDADLASAVDAVAFGSYLNSGQICMSADRVIVQRGIAAEFTERLAERAARLPAGDPTDPETVIGPLINLAAVRRVSALVTDALDRGAVALAGGVAADGAAPGGTVYPATVLAGVDPGMRIHTEEIFGPVCTVVTVDDPDQAVAVANDSPYGLTAGVLTADLTRGLAMARRLQTGIVHVNDQPVDDEPQAPFGGVKDSGYGRFGGGAGIDAFTDLRWITLQHRPRPVPF